MKHFLKSMVVYAAECTRSVACEYRPKLRSTCSLPGTIKCKSIFGSRKYMHVPKPSREANGDS